MGVRGEQEVSPFSRLEVAGCTYDRRRLNLAREYDRVLGRVSKLQSDVQRGNKRFVVHVAIALFPHFGVNSK